MTAWRDDNTHRSESGFPPAQPWQLRLYVAGTAPRSERALANLRACCEQHLAGQYSLEVIDVQQYPQLARRDQVLALPLLVRRLPSPRRCLVGDLSNPEQLLRSLFSAEAC